jgi:Zn-dependent M32 family carboxypeptidase
MALIKTIPEEQAEGLLQEWYQADAKANGYLPNYTTAFSLNPEAYDAWKKLIGAVRSKMRLRRFELVTFATAMELKCTY